MLEKNQRFCIKAGLSWAPLFCIGLVMAGFFPPPPASMDANATAQMFAENRTLIRIGILITTLSAPLLAFFVAALTHQVRRIAGATSPLAIAQTIAGSCLILEFIIPQMLWQTAAFRVGRAPETIQALNDAAWLIYVGVNGTAIVQMLILAMAIFQDSRLQPLIPRWCAYLCAWTAMGSVGGGLCVFVQSGVFAWNGLVAWWIMACSFFIWMVVMIWQMLRASRRVEHDKSEAAYG